MLLVVGENRQHGGNEGYEDDIESCYRWDSTVPNHGRPRVGDVVAVWDKRRLIGTAVIGSIDEGAADKNVYRCAQCGQANIKQRKTKTPLYRCFDCFHEFDQPVARQVHVTTYAAQYQATWASADRHVTAADLRQMAISPAAQNSIRQLDWDRFAVGALGPRDAARTARASRTIAGGHVLRTTRVRVGQAAFRQKLLDTYGSNCAVTGPCPRVALEAAHLYSYASTGEHRDGGGLLLRRDVHSLFDAGAIAVHPGSLLLDVDEALSGYQTYGRWQGAPLAVGLTARQTIWLSDHWSQHRR